MFKQSALAVIIITSISSNIGFSGTKLFDPANTCENKNCSSASYTGLITSGSYGVEPFIAQVYVNQGQCLRAEVVSATYDLEMTIATPRVRWNYYNDDGGSGTNPLVKIDNAPREGFYTIMLSNYNGAAAETKFTLKFGRYQAGNTNCIDSTAPQLSSNPEVMKEENITD